MGGGGGSDTTTYIKSQAPEVFTPIAPERTAPEAMPENAGEALFTSGAKRTEKEKTDKNLGSSRLVIPLEGAAQSGGFVEPRTPTGVV